MKKLLEIIGYLMLTAIVILPFYTDLSLSKTLPPYILSTVWFLMALLAGMTDRISWVLLLLYFTISAILFSYGFIDFEILGSMALGIIWAILIFYTNNSSKHFKSRFPCLGMILLESFCKVSCILKQVKMKNNTI